MKKPSQKQTQYIGVAKGGTKSMTKRIAKGTTKSSAGDAIKWLIGIDEVGRGPLAGPVAVCACILPYHGSIKGTYKKFYTKYKKEIKSAGLTRLDGKDSKKLKAKERELWFRFLSSLDSDVYFLYGEMSAESIDKQGIAVCIRKLIDKHLQDFIKMIDAVEPQHVQVLLDGGLKAPTQFMRQQTIIKGDEKELVISLASIYAKVRRDTYMIKQSKKPAFSAYGFEVHKGYGTRSHREKICRHGTSIMHRKSFLKKLLT